MAADRDWTVWINVAGSIASLTALGYLLMHLPRRGERKAVVAGLGAAFPKGLDLKASIKTIEDEDDSVYRLDVVDNKNKAWVGMLEAELCSGEPNTYSGIVESHIHEHYRGRGIYPAMLTKMRNHVKKEGCSGLMSYAGGRNDRSSRSWEKFAERERRVKKDEHGDYYFSGLPKTGRIPMATARRALARLPKKSQKCAGMTAASLREGMEIEREHRDVTHGTVGRTAKIAAAHICESGTGYYKGLKKLERRLKAKR